MDSESERAEPAEEDMPLGMYDYWHPDHPINQDKFDNCSNINEFDIKISWRYRVKNSYKEPMILLTILGLIYFLI